MATPSEFAQSEIDALPPTSDAETFEGQVIKIVRRHGIQHEYLEPLCARRDHLQAELDKVNRRIDLFKC